MIKIKCNFNALQINWNPDSFLAIMKFVDILLKLKDEKITSNIEKKDEHINIKNNKENIYMISKKNDNTNIIKQNNNLS